ncbi:MAG: galactokinase [Aerococcus sp.]|nr:galactokinase [Aerococcus sp.]
MEQALKTAVSQKFVELFHEEPTTQGFAPGRVNLIGEHTDYNGGHVFPCAITNGTYGAARRNGSKEVRCYSDNFSDDGIITFSLEALTFDKADGWTNFVKGMVKFIQAAGYDIAEGFDLSIAGNIPNGAGLSSSASLELLIGVLVRDLFDLEVEQLELIRLGQRTENDFIGVNSGIMDQFAVGMGETDHAIFLDTNTLEYELVPADFKDNVLLIMNTNKRRELSDSKYNERRSECEEALRRLQEHHDIVALGALTPADFEALQSEIGDETLVKRARHAVTENARTIAAKQVLEADDLKAFGELMNASHRSLRDDYDVTGVELDTLVAAAWEEEGVIGARMTGAGMGGCAIALVAKDAVDTVKAHIQATYTEKIGYAPSFYVANIGNGAHTF